MLTQFTGHISAKGINVTSMISKSKGDWAYSILDISESADAALLDEILDIDGVVKVRKIK